MSDASTPAAGTAAAPSPTPTTTASAPTPDQPPPGLTPHTTPTAPLGESAITQKSTPVKYKVKVDGQESEVDEAELVKAYERRQASYKRFEEAAKRDKQARALAEAVRDRRRVVEVLRRAGHDPAALAEEILGEHLAKEQMTPEQRRAYDLEMRERELEARQRAYEERVEKAQFEQETAQQEQYFEREFTRGLQAAKVPKTPWAMRRMAALAQEALDKQVPCTAQDLAEMVRDELHEEASAYVKDLDDGTFERIAGPRLQAIRQRDLERIKAAPPGAKPPAPVETPRRNPETGQFQKTNDLGWLRQRNRK